MFLLKRERARLKIAQIGESILQQVATPVVEFNSVNLIEFIQAMLEQLKRSNGVGIAAPQVFDSRAIMIIASKPNPRYPHAPDMEPLVLINPAIKSTSVNKVKDWEGCLSVPGLRGLINRYEWIEVSYQDVAGKIYQVKFDGFIARIFQHEFDHLIAKTWLDQIESTADVMAESLWRETILSEIS